MAEDNGTNVEHVVISYQPGTENVKMKGPATLGALAAIRIAEELTIRAILKGGKLSPSGIVLPRNPLGG